MKTLSLLIFFITIVLSKNVAIVIDTSQPQHHLLKRQQLKKELDSLEIHYSLGDRISVYGLNDNLKKVLSNKDPNNIAALQNAIDALMFKVSSINLDLLKQLQDFEKILLVLDNKRIVKKNDVPKNTHIFYKVYTFPKTTPPSNSSLTAGEIVAISIGGALIIISLLWCTAFWINSTRHARNIPHFPR